MDTGRRYRIKLSGCNMIFIYLCCMRVVNGPEPKQLNTLMKYDVIEEWVIDRAIEMS